MLCFLQKAHHQRKPDRPWNSKSGSLVRRSFSTKSRMAFKLFLVRLLNGEREISQQNSSTAVSSSVVSPASSRTIMRFDLPRMLSYRVPLGIPYLAEAWVKRIFCVTTAWIASFSCACVQTGALSFTRLWASNKHNKHTALARQNIGTCKLLKQT